MYTVQVSKQQLAQLKKDYVVTGMHVQGNMTTVRLIAEKCPTVTGVKEDAPNVEDAYMYCLVSHGCEISGGEL